MKDNTFILIGMLILGGGAFLDARVRLPAIIAIGIIDVCLICQMRWESEKKDKTNC